MRRMTLACSSCRLWRPGAEAVLAAAGVMDRCEVVVGDFFRGVPTGADCYVLANVLHDWDDAKAVEILASCRKAATRHGRVLIVERLLPDDPTEAVPALQSDINMLVLTGGRERTNSEYGTLLQAAGLRLGIIRPVTGCHSPPGPEDSGSPAALPWPAEKNSRTVLTTAIPDPPPLWTIQQIEHCQVSHGSRGLHAPSSEVTQRPTVCFQESQAGRNECQHSLHVEFAESSGELIDWRLVLQAGSYSATDMTRAVGQRGSGRGGTGCFAVPGP